MMLFTCSQYGFAVEMIPANLEHASESLEAQILFPKREISYDLFVRCEGFVTRRGRYRSVLCYRGNVVEIEFEREVLRRTRRAKAEPAMIDGRKKSVWLQFGVLFLAEEKRAVVYQTIDSDLLRLGKDYKAPQRYGNWMRCGRNNLTPTMVHYKVLRNGSAKVISAGKKEHSDQLTSTYAKCFASMSFIPPSIDKQWFEAEVIEPFFSVESLIE